MYKYLVVLDGELDENFILSHYEGTVFEIDDGGEDPLPKIIEEYLLFPLDKEGAFVVDFEKVARLLDHVVEKPMIVSQTLLRLHTALGNHYNSVYEKYNAVKDSFEQEEARIRVRVTDEDNEDAPNIKKTGANIEAMIKNDPSWQLKKMELNEMEQLKAKVYTAKEAVKRAYDLCSDFIKNGKNVWVEKVPERALTGSVRDVIVETEKIDIL